LTVGWVVRTAVCYLNDVISEQANTIGLTSTAMLALIASTDEYGIAEDHVRMVERVLSALLGVGHWHAATSGDGHACGDGWEFGHARAIRIRGR
jgi:hypothetical protein